MAVVITVPLERAGLEVLGLDLQLSLRSRECTLMVKAVAWARRQARCCQDVRSNHRQAVAAVGRTGSWEIWASLR